MGDMVKFRPNKKVILSIVTVLGVLVVAGGAGFGFRYIQDHNTDIDPKAVGGKAQPLPADVEKAQNLRISGDTDGSLKKIDESIASASTAEKYQLYIQQGNTYVDKGDKPAALNAYLEAEKIQETYEITSLLAIFYEGMGDKAKALEYYKKALPLIPDSPVKGQYQEDTNQKIKELEA